jgi:hypothetical protein
MLIFWDIDGTLLTAARSGTLPWGHALQASPGVRAGRSEFDPVGHHDALIAWRLLVGDRPHNIDGREVALDA